MEDAAAPRRLRGAELEAALREDLDAYGLEELQERIGRLQAEVERTRAVLVRKQSGRHAADAFFSLGKA